MKLTEKQIKSQEKMQTEAIAAQAGAGAGAGVTASSDGIDKYIIPAAVAAAAILAAVFLRK